MPTLIPSRSVRLLWLAPLLATSIGCLMTRGDGELASRTHEVAPFHVVDVGGVFQLEAVQAAETSVEVRGDANLVAKVEVTVTDGRLRARIEGNVLPDLPLELVVRAPVLDEIELSGASRGDVQGIDAEHLELELSGSSTLVVRGRVAHLEANVSGASELDAAGVQAERVDVDASGASKALVTANTAIDANASGASSITWQGPATTIERKASGASTIEHR